MGRTLALCAGLLAAAGAAAPPGTTVLHVSSHLARNARVWLDGGKPVAAPGYGSTTLPAKAGHHLLKVTTAAGVTYQAPLDLKPEALMTWRGRGYWCVNLLERSLETYSTEDCEEDVTDAG
ncbi:MAG: hypothetical protein JO127_00635 [Caulobacteraceae bacterium]|nr:hypothetical protein [Caulobacteraceae bacterium]